MLFGYDREPTKYLQGVSRWILRALRLIYKLPGKNRWIILVLHPRNAVHSGQHTLQANTIPPSTKYLDAHALVHTKKKYDAFIRKPDSNSAIAGKLAP